MAPPDTPVTVELAPLAPWLDGPACLRLPAGATVGSVLEALDIRLPAGWETGVWGRPARPDRMLASGDRIEFTRPLQADPRSARRARAQRRP